MSTDKSGTDSPQKKRRKMSHKKPIGGLSKFLTQYAEKYKGQCIEASKKGNDQFYCRACDQYVGLHKSGEKAIKDHINGKKHKEMVTVVNKNHPISSFVKRKTVIFPIIFCVIKIFYGLFYVSEENRALAAELVMAFHSGRHNFSMSSADCSSAIIPVVFEACSSAENFASARTKTTAIINGVLEPFLKKRILSELNLSGGYFSIGFDSTSMNKQRYYALVIRYFCGGIKTRILRLLEQASEKSIDMTELISEALKINGLDLKKMVALTADNTNANFGGINRGGSNNLFYLLKQENPKLVGIGCPSHISSNAVQFAVEQMEYDLLGFANGLTAHFSNHALRWERFHECAQVLGIEAHVFPEKSKTRWLSLGRLCEEIVRMWTVIESYFRSITDCPMFMRRIFNGNLANANEFKVLFYFASFTLDHFNRFNATSQTPNMPFPKLISILQTLKRRLAFSRDDGYYGDQTMRLLAEMEKDGEFDMCLKLKSAFKKFYDDSLSYMNKWCVHLEDIATFFGNWLTFESSPSSENILSSYKRLCSAESRELDNLFGEIAEMNETLEQLQGTEFDSKSVEEKWSILFKNPNFILLKKLVSILLSVFSSNAFCESIFSVVKNLKSDERNRMQLKLLNSLLSIKFNADFDCVKAHELFLSRTDLLEEVKRGEKYVQ